jgi:uncharacterized protein YxjI
LSIPLSCHILENKILSFSLIIGDITDKTFNLGNTYNISFCYEKWKLQIDMCVAISVVKKKPLIWEFCANFI